MPDITIEGPDGTFGAYLAIPDKTPAPGVVVAQEIFGVNQVMRDVCDWLAGAGLCGLPVRIIFWRIEPGIQLTDKTKAEWARAFELFKAVRRGQGHRRHEADAALALMRTAGGLQRQGRRTVGYCLGGKIAYLMATRSYADCKRQLLRRRPGRAAAARPGKISKPLTDAHGIQGPIRAAGGPGQDQGRAWPAIHEKVALHVYEGQDHAFAREGRRAL